MKIYLVTIGALFVPGAAATCMNDFMCPANAERIPYRSCYNDFDDCQCIPGYYKSGNSCVTNASSGCDKSYDFATRISSRSCFDTIDDFDCIPGYNKSGDACVTNLSSGCNVFFNHAIRKSWRSCFDTIDDYDCLPGFKKQGTQCVFNNPWGTTPPENEVCALFQCPPNSKPTASDDACIASFDDCSCLPHYSKNGNYCVCANSYNCPANSQRISGRVCYDTFDDCKCNSGYIKSGEECVPGEEQEETQWTNVPLPVQTFYVPLPEKQIKNDTFEKINSITSGWIRSTISISVGVTGTVIWYDHMEDGFEDDVTASGISETTQIWGDGNIDNGCAPGTPCSSNEDDILVSGRVIILESDVDVNHPTGHDWNGGDCIKASWPIAVTRGEYPQTPGSLLAGAVEVLDTKKWGTYFEAPVGQDLATAEYAFEYVGMYAMARKPGTIVTIKNKSGTTLSACTLGEGESCNVRVNVGDSMTSNEPIQVDILAGDVNSSYEMRWYSVLPVDKWSKTYLTPVGDDVGETRCVIYNPTESTITVTYKERANGVDQQVVLNSKQAKQTEVINTGSAAYISSPVNVIVFSMTDTVAHGMIFDWGFPVQPIESLSPQVLVGWGYGCTDNACDSHAGEDKARSVVWIAPTEDAVCQVDFDNDGEMDVSYFIGKYVSFHISDESDQDMSGAMIVCKDSYPNGNGVPFAAAWGQDPTRSFSNDNDALDMGTTVMPYDSCYTQDFVVMNTDGTTETFTRTQNLGFGVGCGDIEAGDFSDSPPVQTSDPPEHYIPVTVDKAGGGGGGGTTSTTPATTTTTTTTTPATTTTTTTTPATTTTTTTSDGKSSGGGGDPHFQRWGRDHSTFHGECDLVLVSSKKFNSGSGLDLHARTTIESYFSYIETAALRVGEHSLEFHPDRFYLNGVKLTPADLPMNFGDYTITSPEPNASQNAKYYQYYNVALDGSTDIVFRFYKQYLTIKMNGNKDNFGDAVGLLGDYENGDMYGRDGIIFESFDALGFEWQVNPSDPQLFVEEPNRSPQLPFETCRMPTAARPSRTRMLRANNDLYKQAEAACSHVSSTDHDLCIDDVVMTNDVGIADLW